MTTRQLLISAWDLNPLLIGVCLGALFGYAKLTQRRLPARSGCFFAGVAVFILTLASPVNFLAAGYLFSAHMLQHLLLLLVVPPLLLLGLPAWKVKGSQSASPAELTTAPLAHALAPALAVAPQIQPETKRMSKSKSMSKSKNRPTLSSTAAGLELSTEQNSKRSAPSLTKLRIHPFAAWLAGLSAMWIWHERTLCDLATTTQTGRVIQIISLVVLGALFWWPIVGPQMNRRLPPLLGIVYLFSACVGCTILGILITFAPVGVVCPVYLHPLDRLGVLPLIQQQWGITPAKDQQMGGLMMWVPACGIYISGVITLLARWYRSGETGFAEPPKTISEPAPAFSSARTTRERA